MLCPKSTIPKKIETDSYLLCTGETDLERLTILNDLYNPSSLDFLKIESGMKILTIGCGVGLLEIELAKKVGAKGEITATDISSLQLAIALENKEKASVPNLTFKELDVAQLNLISEQFDRVHCRFVLSHMPWESIKKLLPLLMSKLTSGGALVLEEVSNMDSLGCEPFSEAYELWKTFVHMQFDVQGSDHSPGRRLYEYLQEQGYDFVYQTHQPKLKQKREKKILSLGIRSLAPGFIEKKRASSEQILDAMEQLKILEEDPNIIPVYTEVSQFFIKRSKG